LKAPSAGQVKVLQLGAFLKTELEFRMIDGKIGSFGKECNIVPLQYSDGPSNLNVQLSFYGKFIKNGFNEQWMPPGHFQSLIETLK